VLLKDACTWQIASDTFFLTFLRARAADAFLVDACAMI
jgi:hypothetical protein